MFPAVLFAFAVITTLTGTGEAITAENIAIGKVGVIDRLTVIAPLNDVDLLAAQFGGVKVLVEGYPAKGVGKGKVLPKEQVWRVTEILKTDTSGHGLAGCYVIVPNLKKKAPEKPKKK